MVWKAEELPSRLRVASVVGKRSDREAVELISKVRERSDGEKKPLFLSDNLDNYPHALLSVYGKPVKPPKKRRRGRPRKKPVIRPPRDLLYGQVVKHRDQHGRITSIERRIVLGSRNRVKEKLREAGCYAKISTSHIERDNLTSRQTSSRLVRDAVSFSKKMEALRYHTALDDLSYNFSKYHGSLRVKLDNPQRTRGGGYAKEMVPEDAGHGSGHNRSQVVDGRADDLSDHRAIRLRDIIKKLKAPLF